MYQGNRTRGILLLRLNVPVILHSMEFEILTCTTVRASRFQNFLGGGDMPPDPPRGSHLRRSYLITLLNKYFCQYDTLPKTSDTVLRYDFVCTTEGKKQNEIKEKGGLISYTASRKKILSFLHVSEQMLTPERVKRMSFEMYC